MSSARESDESLSEGDRPLAVSRRAFLRGGAAGVGFAMLTPTIFEALSARGALGLEEGRAYAAPDDGGYGPLAPVADQRDGVPRISLPKGFQYVTFSVAGTPMSNKKDLVPLAHDGMAAFTLNNGNILLIRNHEDRNLPGVGSTAGPLQTRYDPVAGGGTTSLEINPRSRRLVRDYISLNGTIENCAGGTTPWRSWLTCEETTAGPTTGWTKPHGYVFDVPARADGTVRAVPLPRLGRFAHEASLADFATGIVYETEDNGLTSGFYRFLPERYGDLRNGRLQMLAVRGNPAFQGATGQEVGARIPVTWVDIPNPDPAEAETNRAAVFLQGRAKGGAAFARLEGIWAENNEGRGGRRGDDDDREDGGSIFFNSTNGGNAGVGQVWEFRPRGRSEGSLVLLFESTAPTQLDFPDNICVTPRGGLLLCQDGSADQYLRGLTKRGRIFDFSLNLQNDSEWAGSTFSPDGRTLFVNRQGTTRGPNPPVPGTEGMTFAIWGPWETGIGRRSGRPRRHQCDEVLPYNVFRGAHIRNQRP